MQGNDFAADRFSITDTDGADGTQIDHFNDLAPELPAQDIVALLADTKEVNRLTLGDKRKRGVTSKSRDGRIERATKTALGSADNQQINGIAPAAIEESWNAPARPNRGGKICQHSVHPLSVGPCRFSRSLRAAQLRRRNHLHCLGDLLCRFDGGN